MKNTKSAGFTLIELIITVTLIGVVLSVGVPSFREILQSNRISVQTNELVATLNYARSEAVKRGINVTICKANVAVNASTCAAGVDWENGWIIFVDQNTLGTIDGSGASADILLKVHEPLPTGYTLRTGGTFTDWIGYLPSGVSKGSGGLSNDTFRICPPPKANALVDATKSRRVIVNTTGRPAVSKGINTDICP